MIIITSVIAFIIALITLIKVKNLNKLTIAQKKDRHLRYMTRFAVWRVVTAIMLVLTLTRFFNDAYFLAITVMILVMYMVLTYTTRPIPYWEKK